MICTAMQLNYKLSTLVSYQAILVFFDARRCYEEFRQLCQKRGDDLQLLT